MRAVPWIRSAGFDSLFILAPPLAVALVALLMPARGGAELPAGAFLLLIVGVDAAHVYGTFWRAYLDPATRRGRPLVLWLAPFLCWAAGAALYASGGAMLFWRLLAYLAVFHFVRQAYGFMMVYGRLEPAGPGKWLDRAAIYAATLYPLIWWHGHLPRSFHWFVADDFLPLVPPAVISAAQISYWILLALYGGRALAQWLRGERNWAKHFWLAGTALAWHAGIISRDSDLIFTLTNVIAHGIPYMALVWSWRRRGGAALSAWDWTPLFIAAPVAAAFIEEALWDRWVWFDHAALFGWTALPAFFTAAQYWWLVPLLSLPQSAHYVQDGFLWRLTGRDDSFRGGIGENSP